MSAGKNYLELPLREFLNDAAAKSPTPGGGSVAAMVGALGVSMARMVLAYTVGKRHFARHETELRQAADEFARASRLFEQLMAEDMAAYERFAAARQSEDEEEQQRALATAAVVPLELAALADVFSTRLDKIKAIVNPNLYSDLRVAAILAATAAEAAAVNVRINLDAIQDSAQAGRMSKQLEALLRRVQTNRDQIVAYEPGT